MSDAAKEAAEKMMQEGVVSCDGGCTLEYETPRIVAIIRECYAPKLAEIRGMVADMYGTIDDKDAVLDAIDEMMKE